MNELSLTQRPIKRYQAPEVERGVIEDVRKTLAVVRRRWPLFVCSLVLCVAVAGLYVWLARTTYRASARVLINQPPALRTHGGMPIVMGDTGESDLPNHMVIMRSPLIVDRALALAGLKGLGVGQVITGLKVANPEKTTKVLDISYLGATSEECVRVVEAVVASYDKFITEEYQKSNKDVVNLYTKARDDLTYEVKKLEDEYMEFRKSNSTGATDANGRPFAAQRMARWDQVGNQLLLRSLEMKKKLELAKKLTADGMAPAAVAEALKNVNSEAEPPQAAAAAAETTKDSFESLELEFQEVELRRQMAERFLKHLQDEKDDRASRPVADETALARAFYSRPEVAPLEEELRKTRRQISASSRLTRGADVALRRLQTRAQEMERELAQLWARLRPELAAGESGAMVDDAIRQAEAQLLVLKAREGSLRERTDQVRRETLAALGRDRETLVKMHGADHPDTKRVQEQITRLEGKGGAGRTSNPPGMAMIPSIERSIEVIESMRSDIQKQFEEDLAASRKADIELLNESQMRGKLDRHRALFNSLTDQLRQIQFVSDVGQMTLQTISAPAAQALRPNLLFVMTLALLAGCTLGTTVSFAIEMADTRIRTPSEMGHYGQLTLLGSVPRLESERERADVGMICRALPSSPQAEAFKTIRTSLEFIRRSNERVQALLVSSPCRGEGKSTTASNLAISLAHAGRRVLLIDGDLRSPSQHEIHGTDLVPGLVQVLKGRTPWRAAVRPTSVEKLDLLSAGSGEPFPSELLASEQLIELLSEARARAYDVVLIDSSPLLSVADPSIIAGVVDGTVLVVRARATRRQEAEQALELLDTLKIPLLGVVVNAVTVARRDYGYGSVGDDSDLPEAARAAPTA